MAVLVDIQRPIWNGGRPHIGVADFRVKGTDVVKVRILYQRKDGKRSFPDTYFMPANKLVTYPVQVVGSGVRLYVAPLTDWSIEPVEKVVEQVVPEPKEEVVEPENLTMFDVPKVDNKTKVDPFRA